MSISRRLCLALGAAAALPFALVGAAQAEVSTVRLAQQYGLTYLPLVVMEHDKLIEKNAPAAGLGTVKVEWTRFAGGNAMNDAILSGNLDFGATGMPSFLILWDKGERMVDVKGIASYGATPLYLVTRNPAVKHIRDFTDKDRIAVPAVRSSVQAILLQMAAEKEWGVGQHGRLDGLTVSRAHPDAYAQLIGGQSEVNSHFGAPPFQQMALGQPGIHKVVESGEIIGGSFSNGVIYATNRFVEANPRMTALVRQSLQEAIDGINKDMPAAAQKYLTVSGAKTTVEEIMKLLSEPGVNYQVAPENTFKFAEFMFRIGSIKRKPESWKDLYFPVAHDLPGS